MFKKLQRAAAGLITVLAVFWVYRSTAVPLIEPPVVAAVESGGDLPTPLPAKESPLAGLFPPGSWELNNPIVLESDQAKLLINRYENLPDGRVRLTPCTIVFTGSDHESEKPAGRTVIMQAPQGATLTFDQPLDLKKVKIGKLIGGDFLGPITIYGNATRPGANDALRVTTRDVQMREDKIWTPHPVEFEFGPNSGRGRDMRIDLMPAPITAGGPRHGPNVGGVQAFELGRDVVMHLQPGAGGLLPGDRDPQTAGAAAAGSALAGPAAGALAMVAAGAIDPRSAKTQPPVDVKCQGPFRFDMVNYVATFQDKVDVIRATKLGPSDQMQCQTLSIFFTPRRDKDGKPRTGSVIPPLEPQRVEARGNPVVLHSPSTGGRARGERLEYDIPTGRVTLEGQDEVMLEQKTSEIHARSLVYTPGEAGRLGRLTAMGPGWLRGVQPGAGNALPGGSTALAGAGGTQLDARFSQELRLRPHEQNQVVSLLGQAELSFGARGKLSANEIHLWMNERLDKPASLPHETAAAQPASRSVGKIPGAAALSLDRMLAKGTVRIASPQLSGKTEQLEVWFKALPAHASAIKQVGYAADPRDYTANSGLIPQPRAPRLPGEQFVPALAARPAASAADPSAALKPTQHFRLAGTLIRVQVLMRGPLTEVEDVSIDGAVDFVESQTGQQGERPILIRGDQLQVLRATSEMAVTVTGKPAHVEARGLVLDAADIQLNRGANRFWIDGPGRMQLPAGRGLAASGAIPGGSIPSGGVSTGTVGRDLAITWQQRMTFDGLLARFEKEVVAHNDLQSLRTETLGVRLVQRIEFANRQQQAQAQVDQLQCQGGVVMENRTYEGVSVSATDRILARDLTVNQTSGAIYALGPGTLTSWRLGAAAVISLPGMGGAGAAGGAAAGSSDSKTESKGKNQINYLNVNFQRAITGNVHQKELVFNDQVKTVYGPVASWQETIDPDSSAGLGPRAVLLNTDQLKVNQQPAASGQRPPMELEAIGNTLVEGTTFTARAHRLSYTEVKDLLIFEGDGRNDAQLFRQQVVGGATSRAAARKILYWRTTERVEIDDARFLDLSGIGARPTGGPASPQLPKR